MLHSTYNLNRLGTSTAGDLINTTTFDGVVGGSSNYFGTSPPFNPYNPNNTLSTANMFPIPQTTATTAYLPPLRRRNSIGGLPSDSMTDYLNQLTQNADIAHLSNLLNETKTSITRSSQILCHGENISGDILLSAAAGGVTLQPSPLRGTLSHESIYNPQSTMFYNLQQPTKMKRCTDLDITSANVLNQLPIAYSSQPNIYYSQPNYTNSCMPTDFHLSRFKRSSATAPFSGSSLRYGAMLSKLHQTNPMTAYTNPYFTSNTMNNYPNNAYASYSNSLPYNCQQQSYQMFNTKYKQPPPPYSSVLSSSHHFDPHHLNSNRSYSKLDLIDYTKQGDHNKRQVSFNIDVDTLSIDS